MKEHYPKSLAEFEDQFGSAEQCWQCLFALRWPDGFDCPKCHGRRDWRTKGNLLVCANCPYQASVTAGTVFQGTHKPPEDHQARLVWEYVDGVDLAPLYEPIRAVEGRAGRDAIDPKILLALWLYATLDGVGSARQLDRLCRDHVAYQWMCGGVSTAR